MGKEHRIIMNTLLTTREVVEILNVSYQTIRRLKSDPIEPLFYLRIGGSYVKKPLML